MPTSTTEPSTPNPATQVLVAQAVRAVLQIIGTFGFTWALTVSGSQIELIAGAIMALVGVGWGFYQKFQQARMDHAGNVASARAGQAIKVVAQEGVPTV